MNHTEFFNPQVDDVSGVKEEKDDTLSLTAVRPDKPVLEDSMKAIELSPRENVSFTLDIKRLFFKPGSHSVYCTGTMQRFATKLKPVFFWGGG